MRLAASALLGIGCATAFVFQPSIHTHPHRYASSRSKRSSRGSALASSYLDSLSGFSGGSATPAATASSSSISYGGGTAPNGPIYTTPQESAVSFDPDATTSFSYAPLSYFDVSSMKSKGPRTTADWGTPQDATRKLADDGTFRVGAWYCSEGGWPSPNPKAHTEIFYVTDGHGCLSDADGVKHFFGPGDTVIIPKGHTGRWDVNAAIHKIWAVHDHERIEETANPIRVVVDHYHSLAPQYMTKYDGPSSSPLYDQTDEGASRTIYNCGPTQVGGWTCEAGVSFPFVNDSRKRTWFMVLEGALFVTNQADGSARKCVAGDTVMLPAGFKGHVDVIEMTKKVWTVTL